MEYEKNYAHLVSSLEDGGDDGKESLADNRKLAEEHASKFQTALKKSRNVRSCCAHLVDSPVKLEVPTVESESDEEAGANLPSILLISAEDDEELMRPSLSFKELLQKETDKPFDSGLLAELLDLASRRKAIMRHREARNRTASVETSHEGLSYLDHHPDLAMKLCSTSNQQEQLKLLRGFFFWLQRACDPGAFRPWVSASTDASDDCLILDSLECEFSSSTEEFKSS